MKPSRTLLILLGVLLGLAIALGVLQALAVNVPQSLHALWWGVLLTLTGAALVDALRVRQLPSPRIERLLPGNLPLGRWSEIRLTLHHTYAQPLVLDVFDHVADGMAFEQLPQRIEL
ncbi:MAG: DUF58 domain-containing protein, partial [Pseudomonas sp.]|nr:DUF58 domain-containing protein [Pseudomonas sp.]